MWNAWDIDTKLLAILIVAAIISLAVTHETVLAQTVDGVIQKIEGTVKRLTDQSPSEGKEPTRASDQRERFNPKRIMCCEPDGNWIGRPMRIGVVGRQGWGCVVYPRREIRRCRP